MKKICAGIWLCLLLCLSPTQSTHAAWWTVVTQAIKKVILAMDAQVQRLQNKTIGLQNAQKMLENMLSKLKLEEISDWTEKQREQYARYFDELWRIKNAIATFQEVKELAKDQVKLVQQYQRIFSLLRQDSQFRPEELHHMFQVYAGMVEASLQQVEKVTLVIRSFQTQMSDADRLRIIRDAKVSIAAITLDMQRYTEQNMRLRLLRTRDSRELEAVRSYYGLP